MPTSRLQTEYGPMLRPKLRRPRLLSLPLQHFCSVCISRTSMHSRLSAWLFSSPCYLPSLSGALLLVLAFSTQLHFCFNVYTMLSTRTKSKLTLTESISLFELAKPNAAMQSTVNPNPNPNPDPDPNPRQSKPSESPRRERTQDPVKSSNWCT